MEMLCSNQLNNLIVHLDDYPLSSTAMFTHFLSKPDKVIIDYTEILGS